MKTIEVPIHISADEYLAWYQGAAQDVVATARNGLVVRFPANILQPFVSHSGIHGTFLISFDDNNRFHSIERKGSSPWSA